MPSTYAHYRLGQEIINIVPNQIKRVINENKQLFDIGLHGPDILFYYHPLVKNVVNTIGNEIHDIPGKEFFEYAAQVIKENNLDAGYYAYVYGVICHFVLDASCHGYIDEYIAISDISHAEIEVEFDRFLMLEVGLDPVRHKLSNHIIPSTNNALVISPFYKGISKEEIRKSLTSMIQYNNLLVIPSKIKRQIVYSLLYITGHYKEMHGLIVNYEANPACNESTQRLYQLYGDALKKTVELVSEFDQYIEGQENLNSFYQLTFGGKEIDNGK